MAGLPGYLCFWTPTVQLHLVSHKRENLLLSLHLIIYNLLDDDDSKVTSPMCPASDGQIL